MNNQSNYTKHKQDFRPAKGWWSPGKYMNTCMICSEIFIGDKRAKHCADCTYGTKSENLGEIDK